MQINRKRRLFLYTLLLPKEYCKIKGIYHEFTHSRCPEESGHAESYHGILEEELLSRSEFDSLEDARAALIDCEDSHINR